MRCLCFVSLIRVLGSRPYKHSLKQVWRPGSPGKARSAVRRLIASGVCPFGQSGSFLSKEKMGGLGATEPVRSCWRSSPTRQLHDSSSSPLQFTQALVRSSPYIVHSRVCPTHPAHNQTAVAPTQSSLPKFECGARDRHTSE